MSARLVSAPSVNNWRTTLGGIINSTDTAIGLVSNASMGPYQLTAPGVLVIDRINTSDSDTPATREYISFATIPMGASGVTIAGITRGIGSTAQTHGNGAIIEGILSVTHWGDLVDFLQVDHASDGTHAVLSHVRSITATGVSGVTGIQGNVVFVPGSNISIYAMSGASGQNYIGISGPTTAVFLPPFQYFGSLTSAAYITPAIIVDEPATITSISAVLKAPVSGSSLILDINKNMVTLFTDQGTRPTILGGGTFVSTASIAVTTLAAGDIITLDQDNMGTGFNISVLINT